MFLIDLFIMLADLVDEIVFSVRYGFGSFLWGLAGIACGFTAVLLFRMDLNVLGVIGILGAIVCVGCSWYCTARDIRKKRIDQAAKETE